MKNIKRYFNLFAIIFSVSILSSCVDKVELDVPDGATFLVVEGWITNIDGLQTVTLTYTSPYFDDAPPPKALGATVNILDDEGNEIALPELDNGVYGFEGHGEIGRSYQLNIILADGTPVQSTFEELRYVVPINEIYWQLSEDEPNEEEEQHPDDIYEVLISSQEPAGLGNYYRWRSFLNGKEYQDPIFIFTSGDEFVDGSDILDFNVTEELYSEYDTVTIIQEQISQQASEFLSLLQSQTAYVGSPFDSPPSPIKGNLTNLEDPSVTVLGYFGAAAQDIATTIVGVE